MSKRLQNVLAEEHLTLNQCAVMTKAELRRIPGLGVLTFEELQKLLIKAHLEPIVQPKDNTIGERLKQFRRSERLTKTEFSNQIRISLSRYDNLEMGRTTISTEIIIQIASNFNVTADWILFGEARH